MCDLQLYKQKSDTNCYIPCMKFGVCRGHLVFALVCQNLSEGVLSQFVKDCSEN